MRSPKSLLLLSSTSEKIGRECGRFSLVKSL
jgi:hypothetical protein